MRWFKADLHIHSVLSPCGSLEMSPRELMQNAQSKEIDIIAITDHNSCANSKVYAQAAAEYDIAYIFGVEVQTTEEIHVIALFSDADNACRFSDKLYDSLLPVDNDPDFFGDQVVVDIDNNIKCYLKKALINSSKWELETVFNQVKKFEGFAFPAHVDVLSYSLLGQLGFIPSNLPISAVGITAKCDEVLLYNKFPFLQNYSLIRNSDAHYLHDVGLGTSRFYLEEPTLSEIVMACRNEAGRKVIV